MKKNQLTVLVVFSLLAGSGYAQTPLKIELHDAVRNNEIAVFNRTLTLIQETAYMGIRLSKDYGEGVAWLKGIDFSNGIIEFDVRGEDVKQHSFVGIAFHGQNDSTFDAIYFRPFQFRASDEHLRNRSIQYIALPDYTWRKLREQSPGKYENAVEPAPDPNGWIKVRIVVQDATVATYVNGAKDPSLVVKKVNRTRSGSIGFYVADTSGGDFANITITKIE